jgi:hypothetical protein
MQVEMNISGGMSNRTNSEDAGSVVRELQLDVFCPRVLWSCGEWQRTARDSSMSSAHEADMAFVSLTDCRAADDSAAERTLQTGRTRRADMFAGVGGKGKCRSTTQV